MKPSNPHKYYCRWLPWTTGTLAFAGLTGTLFALSEVLENDTDGDGWTDAEELVAGTNPADATEPWDSDGDGIADYLEFLDGTDPLDPNDPPQPRTPVYGGTASSASVPVFRDLIAETLEGESESANVGIVDLGNPDFNAPAGFSPGHNEETENGRKIRYRVMGSDPNGWSALVGGGVEYWQDKDGATIGVELCAGPNSRGVKQRFNMETTKDFCGGYALVWEHYGRVPKSGTIDYSYTVRITTGDPSTGAAQIVGTELTIESSRIPSGGTAKECFFFGIDETHLAAIEENGLWISMSPNASGTLSAVVGKLRIVKICMAVDKNRDNTVSFGGDDLTSEAEPYRFWINNDCDSADMSEDEVSSIDRTGSDEPDCDNEVPRSWRDLEDFTRLQLRFFGDTEGLAWIFEKLKSEELSARITTPGEAKIRIWRHFDNSGGLSYLDGTQVKTTTGLQVVHVAHGTTPLLPLQTKIWNDWSPGNPEYTFYGISMTHPQLNLLFEGVDEGKSQFSLELSFGKQNYQQTSSVWLELLDVRKMFNQVKISYDGTNKSSSWENSQIQDFSVPWDEEEGEQIVFIHGWNMEESGTASYAETSFKRLWWQNYKGRFSSVYWPTKVGGTTYCESEFVAWKCGASMALYIDHLCGQGQKVNIMAHSMGNIVVGSALGFGSTVNNYALMNAAIPAECYDDSSDLRQNPTTKTLTSSELIAVNLGSTYTAWQQTSVSDDSNLSVSRRGYRGRLKNVSGNLTNFYLPSDFATEEAWEFNNSTQKPWLDSINKILSGSYVYYCYNANGIISKKMRMFITAGEFIDEQHIALIEDVTDSDEVMAYVDSSKTKAIGTEARAGGKISRRINMSDEDESGINFDRVHSAQFIWSIQKTWKFWANLKETLRGE